IANPGDAAIDAAMHPADGPWFYFVTINPQSGETVFSTTYAEHEAAIETWREWCRENPDQGCCRGEHPSPGGLGRSDRPHQIAPDTCRRLPRARPRLGLRTPPGGR